MPTAAQTLQKFIKSAHGEGSRGGKIIGHSKSGHPIYAHKGTFGAHDAAFHKTEEDDDSDGGPHGQIVVPLGHGHTARHVIGEVERDGHDVIVESDWQVHGPDGQRTNHTLDPSFHRHPKAVALAGLHDEHVRDDHSGPTILPPGFLDRHHS